MQTEAVFIGQSPRAKQLLRLIERIGKCRWPCLVLGETGTGKEVVSRLIHQVDPEGPFVTIDCSSLVGPLMESELFGHAKGSFTGAVGAKQGLIELANGGTAFFDEIGELPLDLQAKLLRVLQQKEYRPVGSLQTKKADFRIVAATNRDLAKEVERGTFRRDLFYRLNVITLRLAPLRDRRDDIPALVNHFIERYGRNHVISEPLLEILLSYPWPGNVRELENCVQHMVAVNSGPVLLPHDLPSPLQNFAQQRGLDAGQHMDVPAVGEPLPPSPTLGGSVPFEMPRTPRVVQPLAELERRAILEALEYTRGDRSAAAAMLGIGRTTLYRKLKEYALETEEDRPLAPRVMAAGVGR